MNVLVLMYFPVHVGVSVCVNVSVDFGVDFGGEGRAPLAQEQLLLGEVLLIVYGAHAVFFWAGGAGGGRHTAPVAFSVGQPVGSLQNLGGRGRSTGRGTVLLTLTEPQQHCTQDEHHPSRDTNNDRPGEGVGGWCKYGSDGKLGV